MCSDSDISLIRDWLKKQKHLPQDVEDHYIRSFISAAKGSIQKTKIIFEKFHMLRHILENNYKIKWDPFGVDELPYTDNVAFVMLPNKSPEGHNIMMIKKLTPKGNENHVIFCLAHFYYFIQMQLWDDNMGDCQMIVVMDFANVVVADLKNLNPNILKIISEALTGGSVLRVKAAHDVNVPQVYEWVHNFVTPFMPKKIKERRFVHSKWETLYKYIPKEDLPSDYGGDAPSMAELYEITKKKWQEYRRRLGDQKTLVQREKPFVPSHFEVDTSATFRKLNID